MDLAGMFDNYLIESNKREGAEHEKKEKKFYISDMNKCQRVRWLKRKGVSSSFENHVYWTFQIGNLYHDWAYEVLRSKELLLDTEAYVSDDHFIGRYDGKIKNIDPSEPDITKALIDLKSSGGYKMGQMVNKGEDNEDYVKQLLTYLVFLKKEGEDIKKGYLLYMNKEPSDRYTQQSFFSKGYYLTTQAERDIQDEMDKMVEFWVKDEIPPCTCPAWMKDYNSYQPFCQMDTLSIRKNLEHLKDENCSLVSTKKALVLTNNETRESTILEEI